MTDLFVSRLSPPLRFLRSLWRLNHALERRSSRMQHALGITAQQRHVLRCLGTLGATRAGALADALHLDPGTLSATIRRLEQRGLVERTREATDNRAVQVALTDAGRLLDTPAPHTVEHAVEQLIAETAPDDLERVGAVLGRLCALLDGGETPSNGG